MLKKINKYFPHILLVLYIIYFIVLAIEPYERGIWFAENLPIVIIVVFLVLTYKKFKFSNLSYLMMSVLIFLHTTGGHFTFERVPFDLVTNFFNFERNHFDRIAHFSVGFYAYPIAEFLFRKKQVNTKTILILFPIFTIATIAGVYEIIEWIFAISSNPEAGTAFLGSQGDIWDAQKDMLADILGSVFAMILFLIFYKDTKRKKVFGIF